MVSGTDSPKDNRRKYVRLDTVFPVEFEVLDDKGRPAAPPGQGFTRNVGRGGMCIFYKFFKSEEKKPDLKPSATRLKLTVNIPLDTDPVECLARVEWIEVSPARRVDTYLFGVSYVEIAEGAYERIERYVRWLVVRKNMRRAAFTFLAAAAAFSFVLMQSAREEARKDRIRLVNTVETAKEVMSEKALTEEKKARMEELLKAIVSEQKKAKSEYRRLAEEKKELEETTRIRQQDTEDLSRRLEELSYEKDELKEKMLRLETESIREEEETVETEAEKEAEDRKLYEKRLADEKPNYDKFKEYILSEKLQSLAVYLYSHKSSVYYAASLFALAELRYKYDDKILARENYEEIIENFPNSKYALYASHRLDQLNENDNYESVTLRRLYEEYNLPELFDYRNIEPYVKY